MVLHFEHGPMYCMVTGQFGTGQFSMGHFDMAQFGMENMVQDNSAQGQFAMGQFGAYCLEKNSCFQNTEGAGLYSRLEIKKMLNGEAPLNQKKKYHDLDELLQAVVNNYSDHDITPYLL